MNVGSDKLRLLRQIPTVKFEEEMRGYSKSQVDRVLDTLAPLADEIESLQQQLHDANERADEAAHRASVIAVQAIDSDQVLATQSPDGDFDQTLRNTLLLAQRTADQTIRDAERKAEEMRRDSTAQADSIMAGARAEAKELKGEAHAQREQMLADAESERAQLLAEALEHAETRKAAIEEELLSEQGIRRNELLAEISQLERGRDDLSADVNRFEQFLEGRRESIRSALTELNAVLEDPELLAETEVPEPAEIGLLDPDELATLSVESHSIGTLASEVEAAEQQASDFAFTDPEPEPMPDLAVSMEQGIAEDQIETDSSSFGEDAGSFFGDGADQSHELDETPAMYQEASPAEEFAAAVGDSPFSPPSEAFDSGLSPEDWQPFVPESGNLSDSMEVGEFSNSDQNPFETGGYADPDSGAGIPASVTPDSVFSSVPETSDPSAYSDLTPPAETPVSDPEGLGIDVESPFADEPEAESAQPGLGGLAEQARSRLASRVSKLRDTAVPETPDELQADDTAPDTWPPAFESAPAVVEEAAPVQETPFLFQESPAPYQEPSPSLFQEGLPPAPSFDADPPVPPPPVAEAAATFISESEPTLPPPPEAGEHGSDSSPAFPSDPVEGSEWSVSDPDRPLHPDARIEDLPPDDPFLDELRQMTGGEQPASEDETLNRFLSEDGEKDRGGGWFGRRNK